MGRTRRRPRVPPRTGGSGFAIGFPTGSGLRIGRPWAVVARLVISGRRVGPTRFRAFWSCPCVPGRGRVLCHCPLGLLTAWRGVTADAPRASIVRPPTIGWLVASWMLVSGVTILDLNMEAEGTILAILVPLFWLAGVLAAYGLIDPALKLVAGPALTNDGASTFAAMGLSGYVPGAEDRRGRMWAGGGCSTCSSSTSGPSWRAWGIGGLAFALAAARDPLKNFFRLADADRRPHVPGAATSSRSAGTRVWSSPVGLRHDPDSRARRLAADDPQLRP